MGIRGPTRKTLRLVKLEGNSGHQKKRKPTVGAIKGVCPKPPGVLDYLGKLEWKRLAPLLWAKGLLSGEDRALFSSYCMAWSRWVQAEKVIAKKGITFTVGEKGYTQLRPEVSVSREAAKAMTDLSRRFGLDPRSRQDIDAVRIPEKEKSKMAQLLDEREVK